MTRLNISVVTGDGDRQESGSYGIGGRRGFGDFVSTETGASAPMRRCGRRWSISRRATRRRDRWMWCRQRLAGVMLHEAVGHGLEGDFNRKKTSAFAGLMGEWSPRRRDRGR